MFLIGQLLSTNVLLGQTITMTGPSTGQVCTSDNFSITVNSNTRIWFFLDVSDDLGSTWGLDNSRKTFKKENNTVYEYALRKGWLEECCKVDETPNVVKFFG